MALKIKLDSFPEKGTFDFPIIGSGLTRDKVEDITKDWNQAQIEKFQASFPHMVDGSLDKPKPESVKPEAEKK